MKKIFTLFIVLLGSSILFSQTIYYVKTSGNDANNGSSWATAFRTVQQALSTISSGQIWIAAGTYYPDEYGTTNSNARGAAFWLKNNVALYGGFAGTETQLSQRNWKTHLTRLSGDIDKNGSLSNNSLHVVRGYRVNSTAILDGFTISGGNADDFWGTETYWGGGIMNHWASPTISNCIITGNGAINDAAGILNYDYSSPTMNNCIISANTSRGSAGMLNGYGSSPVLFNCLFKENVSSEYSGGAVLNEGEYDESGAQYTNPRFINCTFWANESPWGSALCNFDYTNVSVTNCIIWGNGANAVVGNTSISYSIVQGGYAGTGNSNADPLFVNGTSGDLHLQFCSPAIEAGNNAVVTLATDLDGVPRINYNRVDMGVYESQALRVKYVKKNATGSNNGSSWANAYTRLQDALAYAVSCQRPLEIWVAEGVYYPDESSIAHTGNPADNFLLRNGVALYGGFAGTETERDQRSYYAHPTVLSGNIDQSETGHKSWHIVWSEGNDTTALLDGFNIEEGNAPGGDMLYGAGAGIYIKGGSPLINNCYFSNNYSGYIGAAMYMRLGASPTIRNCTFSQNTAHLSAGAIYNDEGSAPKISGCRFFGNTGSLYSPGGAIANSASSPIITNCTFMQNEALRGGAIGSYEGSAPVISNCLFNNNSSRTEGGAIYNENSNLLLTNCSFYGNTAPKGAAVATLNNYYYAATLMNCTAGKNSATEGGALYSSGTPPVVTNSVLWGNTPDQVSGRANITFSIVQGGYAGTGNLDNDPMFTSLLAGNFHLCGCSPAINSGTPTRAPASDMDGNERPLLGSVDMGAYEFKTGGQSSILYVNHDAPAGGDGATWDRAFTYLQDALNKAGTCYSPTEVWVAAGTYYPDQGIGSTDNDRYSSFRLKNYTVVYGGFNGTEQSIQLRDWKTNTTTLSGDIDQLAGTEGNAFHVIRAENVDTTSVLDGFTIEAGNANDFRSSENSWGGGIYTQGSPKITNCIFRSNHADGYGGAIANQTSSFPVITNCLFWNNSAPSGGGGIFNYNSGPRILHSSFYGNSGGSSGGAILNMNTTSNIVNSILWGNTAPQIGNASGSANVSYSIVQDGYYPGAGNLKTDPLFVNAVAGDLHLQACSPAIDAGNNAEAHSLTDLDGALRTLVVQTDMGAYEFQGTIIYVKQDATGRQNGTSWANAFTKLQDALSFPTGCSRLSMIWVAKGTYYPDEGTGIINNDRNASFNLRNNLAILGGFDGTETSLLHRLPAIVRNNRVILSGEIDGVIGNAGNSYHVVRSDGVNSSALLDGFTITAGNANGSAAPNNQGGGLYNSGSPTIRYCTFTGNNGTNGGAIYNTGAASVINSIFNQNLASYGGGIYNSACSPAILNGMFWKNNGTSQGGAIYNTASSPAIINGSFNGNTSPYGGGIRNVAASAPAITNCILWGNNSQVSNSSSTPLVSYSIVQGGYTGTAILVVDPLFRDPATGNLRLQYGSPAIDAGINAAMPLNTDNGGDERIYNNIIDLGADEFYPSGTGGAPPLELNCPGNFTLLSDANTCGAIVNYSGEHATTTTGGEPPIVITYDPPAGTVLPVGDTWISVLASDSDGHQRTCNFWVSVVDSTPPVISNIRTNPALLYPPNHQLQDITIDYNTSDNCGLVTSTLTVSTNEGANINGAGNTPTDWQVIDDHHLKLRAERSGNGNDRLYTITISATDAAGNTSTATTTVTVPHDKAAVTSRKVRNGQEDMGLYVAATPNPSSEGFLLITRSSDIQPLNIKVLDAVGRQIESRSGIVANGSQYIGSFYRPGVYYVQVVQGGTMQTIKLVKQSK